MYRTCGVHSTLNRQILVLLVIINVHHFTNFEHSPLHPITLVITSPISTLTKPWLLKCHVTQLPFKRLLGTHFGISELDNTYRSRSLTNFGNTWTVCNQSLNNLESRAFKAATAAKVYDRLEDKCLYYIKQIESMLPRLSTVIDHRWHHNCGKNISDTLSCASCATFLFSPHFDFICDILLNKRKARWTLF